MVNKDKYANCEYLGFSLEKNGNNYLMVKKDKLMSIVEEDWFNEYMEEIEELVLSYYSDFQIYLTYINNPKTILGYVYVKRIENRTGEDVSDVELNKDMLDLGKRYPQLDKLFVTMLESEESFEKLKKGDLKEHFNFNRIFEKKH